MTAAIYLTGLPGIDTPKFVEQWTGLTEQKLKDRLWELQNGYCEGKNDRPMILTHTKDVQGKTRTIMKSSSKADWGYLAIIGFKQKERV